MSAGEDSRRSMVRALLTDGERKAVRDSDEMASNTKSSHISRVRGKIERLRDDAELMRKHRPELYHDLQSSICDQGIEERLDDLEAEVSNLHERVYRLETRPDDEKNKERKRRGPPESVPPGEGNTDDTTEPTEQ